MCKELKLKDTFREHNGLARQYTFNKSNKPTEVTREEQQIRLDYIMTNADKEEIKISEIGERDFDIKRS